MPKQRQIRILKTRDILIGALLRVPSQAIHRLIIKELNAAGFDELRPPHIAVFQYPGPHGVRPSALAERAGISKQAMNQLLKSLEGFGYLQRSNVKDQGRTRVVRLTRRGHDAYFRIYDILLKIESEWAVELGSRQFAQLKRLLAMIWDSPLSK
jgi:DNA-binding MarR family transcriptional regulator